jgi:hypothetical protein
MTVIIEVAIGYSRAPGKFRVEVLHSPAGEASADTDLDAGALLEGRSRFQQTLLASAVSARQILTPAEQLSTRATACASLPHAWARIRPARFATMKAKTGHQGPPRRHA